MGFFNWAAPAFGRYADRWDDEGVGQVTDWLSPYLTNGRGLLDLGGGTGALATRLADALSTRVTILDPTPEMLDYVPLRPDIITVVGKGDAMPFEPDEFDAVIVSDAFHHFRDQDGAVREMQRVVRCGGGVLLLEMDPRGLMRLIVLGEKLLGEPGTFFTPEDLCTFMAERGIDGECERTRGISYRFLGTVRSPDASGLPEVADVTDGLEPRAELVPDLGPDAPDVDVDGA